MARDEIQLIVKEQLIQAYAKLMIVQGSNLLLGDENSSEFIRGRVTALEFIVDLLEELETEGT